MVIPAPALTSDARYARRIRQSLLNRLNQPCRACGKGGGLTGKLEIEHKLGNGGEWRSRLGSTRAEYLRLLSLSDADLHAQAELLCPPCHVAVSPHTLRFQRKAA